MALTARYHPEHAGDGPISYGMDFSPIIPAGMTVTSGELNIFRNRVPPVAADADWTKGQFYTRDRSVFQILTGGQTGTDYLLEWTAWDNRGNGWRRTGLLLVAPTS